MIRLSLLEKTSTVATPIEPDILSVLARSISSMRVGGALKGGVPERAMTASPVTTSARTD